MDHADPSLLINILATEPTTMKIPTKPITLEVETALSPAGLRVMATALRSDAEACPSVQHAATYRSMADGFEAQADAADAKAEQADVWTKGWSAITPSRQEALDGRLQVYQHSTNLWRAYDRATIVYDGLSEDDAKRAAMARAGLGE